MRLTLVAQGVQATGDDAQRLIPGDRHELRIFVAPLFRIGAPHRPLDAVGVVGQIHAVMPLGAELTVRQRVVQRAVDGVDATVGRIDVDAAACRALMAEVLGDDGCARRSRFGMGPLHGVEPGQHAGSSADRADGASRAGGLKESAAGDGRIEYGVVHGGYLLIETWSMLSLQQTAIFVPGASPEAGGGAGTTPRAQSSREVTDVWAELARYRSLWLRASHNAVPYNCRYRFLTSFPC